MIQFRRTFEYAGIIYIMFIQCLFDGRREKCDNLFYLDVQKKKGQRLK